MFLFVAKILFTIVERTVALRIVIKTSQTVPSPCEAIGEGGPLAVDEVTAQNSLDYPCSLLQKPQTSICNTSLKEQVTPTEQEVS